MGGARQKRRENRIFVSYSHHEAAWLDRLRIALAPLLRSTELAMWDDSRIRPSQKWKAEIKKELGQAAVAVLLVSQHFLASEFIAENELPPLLKAAREEGLQILWVPIGPCLHQESAIAEFQAVWDPSRPLNSLRGSQREGAMVEVAEAIRDAVRAPIVPPAEIERRGTDLLHIVAEDQVGNVVVMEDWYAIPWSKVLARAERIDCAVSYMDTWINNAADSLEQMLGRGGKIRFFLPRPGTAAASRVGERFPEYGPELVEQKITNTKDKLRSLNKARAGQVEVRWTETFNMHCLMLLDESLLLVSPYDHFRNNRIQNPTFVIPLWEFPRIGAWAQKEFAGFEKNSFARLRRGR